LSKKKGLAVGSTMWESLQAFVRTLGYSIDGIKNLVAGDITIYNY